MPEPVAQGGRGRLETLAAATQGVAGKGAAQQIEACRRRRVARVERPAKGPKFVRVAAAADAQLQAAVAQRIDDGGVLGHA